jgi:hypothetical protein
VSVAERRIAVVMLLQAVRDAQGDDPKAAADARHWLRTAGVDLADLLGIPPEWVIAWVRRLDVLPYEQLRLFE